MNQALTPASSPSALAAEIKALAGARVLCIGDVMVDCFVYGEVDRISPEAPIPVFRHQSEATMLGGAGNVLRNLTALGAGADFIAVIGDDDTGGEIQALVAAEPGVEGHLLVDPGRESTIKTRYIAGAQQLLRADRECARDIGATLAEDVLEAVGKAIGGAQAVVLSDYGKGVLTPGVTARIIELAAKAGKPVIVDPKGSDFTRYRGAYLLAPNLKELALAAGHDIYDEDGIVATAQNVRQSAGVAGILVTRGRDGMTLVVDGGHRHFPARAREVFDVSGAGDTVVATVAAALAAGMALVDAAYLANAAAGIAVGKIGTAVVHNAELFAALHASERAAGEDKLLSIEAALDLIQSWRAQGFKVGFTNGCFDLLHPGHIYLLDQARAACDRLVVAINSDQSVARLKGEGRPVQPLIARAQVLGGLASVDAVVVFSDQTPLKLIEAMRPDVLVKGADYAKDQVIGGALVEGWGGRVVLADLLDGHSTTGTIARLVK